MAGFNGDFVARTVSQSAVYVQKTAYTALQVGSTPLAGRRHIRIQVKGVVGQALAIAYVAKASDGTYTTPTTDVRLVTVYPGGSIWVEPLGDNVAIYGKMLPKVGVTASSVRVIVTEYA